MRHSQDRAATSSIFGAERSPRVEPAMILRTPRPPRPAAADAPACAAGARPAGLLSACGKDAQAGATTP
jgi:hypothetical protein